MESKEANVPLVFSRKNATGGGGGWSGAASFQEPKTPVLLSRKPSEYSAASVDFCTCERETQASAVMDIARQTKRKMIKSKNQEQEDEMPAMKRGIRINDNLRHEEVTGMKTELSEEETTGTGATDAPEPVGTMEKMGSCDEINVDILSTLSGPPRVPDTSGLASEMLQAYGLAIPAVKNGLISFLTNAKPKDVALMITQANSAFASLHTLNADYHSLYDTVRSYILHCSELSTAEEELQQNLEAVKLVSYYVKISDESTKAARAVSDVEAQLEKAKPYLAPLEAKVRKAKVLLEKLEAELGQRRTELDGLETEKIQLMTSLTDINEEKQAIAADAEEAKRMIKGILHRENAARAAVEETRAVLFTS